MAHGLAADLEQLADFIFRLKTVTARKLPGHYSVVNPLCHFLVFCRSAHCHSILYVRIRPDSGFTWLSVIDPVILLVVHISCTYCSLKNIQFQVVDFMQFDEEPFCFLLICKHIIR